MTKEERAIYNRAYKKRHADKIREQERAYWSKNKEKKKEKGARSYQKNRSKRLATMRDYHKVHRNERIDKVKEWRKNNPGRAAHNNSMSRARSFGADGSYSLGDWETLKKQYGHKCPHCGRSEPEIKLTRDHIIPLSRGGSNFIENIQPLCGDCNRRKHAKMPDEAKNVLQ